MPRDHSRDPDASPGDIPKWWGTLGETDKPSPYATSAWTYTQTVVVEEESCEEEPDGSLDCTQDLPEWWEQLGGTLRPYATASWTYHQDSDFEYEFYYVTPSEFLVFDETYFSRTEGGIVLDSGLFNSPPGDLYDEAEIGPNGQRGFNVKRTFAEVSVYDSLASYPGFLPAIPEPLGNLATEPEPASTSFVSVDVSGAGGPDVGVEEESTYRATLILDTPAVSSREIVADGDFDGYYIEFTTPSNSAYDRPPGTLLGKVSYEVYGSTATIMSWSHYNWEDDTPVRKAMQALIHDLPDCVGEVRVEDDPTAFWVSLGFTQDYKGDPYLRLYR